MEGVCCPQASSGSDPIVGRVGPLGSWKSLSDSVLPSRASGRAQKCLCPHGVRGTVDARLCEVLSEACGVTSRVRKGRTAEPSQDSLVRGSGLLRFGPS
jgi:hypothetical protein